MNKIILGLAFTFCACVGLAQTTGPINALPGGVIDGVVLQTHVPTKKVVAYPYLREADYIWSKRVWSTIDLREKFNYPLYYPLEKLTDRWSLFHILKEGVMSGALVAYKPYDKDKFLVSQVVDGDQFKYPIIPGPLGTQDSAYQADIRDVFAACTKIQVPPKPISFDPYGAPIYDPKDLDAFGNPIMKTELDCRDFEAQDIIEYRIKEDWFFDKQRSVMDRRIIGIAPVRYTMENGEVTGKRELFWVYFPEARYLLQNFYTYNEQNDAMRMSFDDLFWKRKFQSYIDKQTNVYDRDINDFNVGIDALLKSEEIKGNIFRFEHDLWHF